MKMRLHEVAVRHVERRRAHDPAHHLLRLSEIDEMTLKNFVP